MKTLRIIIIVLISVFVSHRTYCQTVKYIEVDGIRYRVVREADESSTFGLVNVTALSYGHYEGDIIIPNAIKESNEEYADTYKVIGIDDAAFSECKDLGNVTISTSIETIGTSAFYLSEMESIVIPYGNLTSIPDRAFYICGIKKISLPGSIQFIGKQAFASSSLEYFESAGGLKEIGESAFSDNPNLKVVKFNDGLLKIGDKAFDGCSNLNYINLPSSLKSIGIGAFLDCEGLKNIVLPLGIREIKDNAFSGSGIESFALPNGFTNIEKGVLSRCVHLSSVSLPESLRRVEDFAFSGCINLHYIVFPSSLKTIGNGLFYQCSELNSVYLKSTIPPTFKSDLLCKDRMLFYEANPHLKIYVPISKGLTYKEAEGWKDYASFIEEYDYSTTISYDSH